jgi:hypothetical protein
MAQILRKHALKVQYGGAARRGQTVSFADESLLAGRMYAVLGAATAGERRVQA